MAIILCDSANQVINSLNISRCIPTNPLQARFKLSSQLSTSSLVDAIVPPIDTRWNLARELALIVAFVSFTALMARVSIPLGFTPVPLTGQTLAVLLTGAALGSRRGGISMATYLIAGSWLPIYAGGGMGLFWNLASGGYLLGFIPAAYTIGFLCERGWDRKFLILLAMLIGNIIIYIPGLIQLSFFIPRDTTLELGLYPFILGDIIKLSVASIALPTAWGLVNWVKGNR